MKKLIITGSVVLCLYIMCFGLVINEIYQDEINESIQIDVIDVINKNIDLVEDGTVVNDVLFQDLNLKDINNPVHLKGHVYGKVIIIIRDTIVSETELKNGLLEFRLKMIEQKKMLDKIDKKFR